MFLQVPSISNYTPKYIQSTSLTCEHDQEVAVYVISDPQDVARRQVIRETWGQKRIYWLTKIKVFFLVLLPEENTDSKGKILYHSKTYTGKLTDGTAIFN